MNHNENTRKWRDCLTVILILCISTLCAACAGQGETGTDKPVDVHKLAGDLIGQVPFVDEMTEDTSDVFYALYQIDENMVKDQAFYFSTGATAEEVAVIEAADPGDVDTLKQAVLSRVEAQKEGFANYIPEELTKLKDPVVEVLGNCVILCVSDDNAKAQEVISSYK